jgi:hypothetical protein
MMIESDCMRISPKARKHASFKNIGYFITDNPSVKEEDRPSHKIKASKVHAHNTFDLHYHMTTEEKRHDILEYQMKEFLKVLRDCKRKNFKRIEIIHGGNKHSPLRNKIWITLSKHYTNIAEWNHPGGNQGKTEINFI